MDTQSTPQAAQAVAETTPEKITGPTTAVVGEVSRPVRKPPQGLRFEWVGDGHYHVVLHFGESFVPVEDPIVTLLSKKRDAAPEEFLEHVIEKVGTNAYLKTRLRTAAGDDDLKTQALAMQEFLKTHKV